MDTNTSQHLVFAGDGDNIGQRHARAILSDDIAQVREVSEHITEGNNFVRDFVESHGGEWISGGGDEFSFMAPPEFVELLDQLRKDYEYIVQATLSVGYGDTISQAGKALLVAKSRGKDQVVQYEDSMEDELQRIGEEENSPDAEAKKIKGVLTSDNGTQAQEPGNAPPESDKVLPEGSDAAVNEPTSCEPPVEDNNNGYDSGYKNSNPTTRKDSYRAEDMTPPTIAKPNLKQQTPVKEAVSTDIQETNRQMNEEPANPDEEAPMIEKPAPKAYHGQAEGDEEVPQSNVPQSEAQPRDNDKPGDLKYGPGEGEQIQPEADVPVENATTDEAEATEDQDMETKHCESCTCADHKDAETTLDEHVDNAQDFENTLDDGQPEGAEETLDQHIDNATDMQDNMDQDGISRPEDYDDKREDMGLSEEDSGEPDLDGVLRDGLDEHAENIQKEKVVNMVGEALEGFKSQKAILDKAKEQAPELYASCISMLRAMIELCSLAGINDGEAEQEVNEIEGQSTAPEETPGEEGTPAEAPAESACPSCGKPHDEAAPQEGPPGAPQQ